MAKKQSKSERVTITKAVQKGVKGGFMPKGTIKTPVTMGRCDNAGKK